MKTDMTKKFSSRNPNPVDVRVGSRIRIFRHDQGWSQTKLGDELGLTFQQVQKYEKGVNRVGSSRLQQIATLLNKPITAFFDEDANRQHSRSGADGGLSMLADKMAHRLLVAFHKLPLESRQRGAVVRLTESMAGIEGKEQDEDTDSRRSAR